MPSWLLVGAWLSLGVVPQQDIGFEERFMSPIASASVAYMADIGVYVTIADRLTVSGFIENYMEQKSYVAYSPFRADFTVEATIRVTDWLRVTAYHECVHPVVSTAAGRDGRYFAASPLLINETKFFVTLGKKPTL